MNRRRMAVRTMTFGVAGMLFAVIGTVADIWWLALLGVAMLVVMAWGVVRLRRGTLS